VNELSIRDVRSHGLSTPFIITVVLAAAGIMWAAPKAARGDYRDLLMSFVVLQSLWIVLFWRMGVYLFMAYVVVEGFLINYFNGLSELNLVKDLFVALLFLSVAVILIMQRRAPFPRLGWVIPFLLFALVYIAEIFNPNLPNIMVGLVGCRVTLYYSLLAAVAYWFFDSVERVIKFFAFMVLVSIPEAAFGIVQYFKGAAWMASISPGFQRAVFYADWNDTQTAEGSFRTFSTFVHTGAFSEYLALMMLITAAFFGLYRMRWQRVVLAAILMLQFFALLTTGGRGAFMAFFLCLGIWWLFQRGSMHLAPAVIVLPVFFYAATLLLGTGFLDRFSTLFNADLMRERNMPLITGWFAQSMQADWAGLGAGYASLASRHVGETALNMGAVENGLAKMRFEAGIPGLILYVGFLLSFVLSSAGQALRVADSRVRWFATPIASFLILSVSFTPLGTPFDVSPTNVYLWFFAGFLGRATTLGAENLDLRTRAVAR
jgi:hypothetical protein